MLFVRCMQLKREKPRGYGRPLYGDQAVISETAVTAAIYYYSNLCAECAGARYQKGEETWGSMSLHWTRGRQAPDAVSYTHLDVYKRQALMRHMIMPCLVLSFQQIGGWVRHMRSSMLEVMHCLLYTSRCV